MPPSLFACGSNGSGQLALGHEDDVASLARCAFDPSCPASTEIVDLVSAASHALLLVSTASGTHLLGAGKNTHGQLGKQCALSCPTAATAFRPLALAREAGLGDGWSPARVAATWTTSFVVYERGEAGSADREQAIVSAGSNDFGELGVAGTPDGPVVLDVLRAGEYVEHLKGGQRGPQRSQRVVGWGACRRGELNPVPAPATASRGAKGKGKAPARAPVSLPVTVALPIPAGAHITDLALGAAHSLALLSNGRVLAWGSDLKGQVAGLDAVNDVTAIAATWNGSYGSNTHGQLLRRDSDPRGRVALEQPTTLTAGSEHILVTAGGKLWSGGWNEHGNLGVGDTADRAGLVEVPVPGAIRRVWGGLAATWVWSEE
ncbi:hypothetical protein VHUM_01875 [Vanrija humicola]|uniref:Uncharacterized protein n=1 Tax=Vanrija humicola TaxID=5417 RepID=A0A7D8ZSF8_VANHU|nr:hypothetical protein VHUM_01875 [Vanrija humicola]